MVLSSLHHHRAEAGKEVVSMANIYKGKGTQKEKESVYDVLFGINASQNATWEKIKN